MEEEEEDNEDKQQVYHSDGKLIPLMTGGQTSEMGPPQ